MKNDTSRCGKQSSPRSERGAALVEYALLTVLIAVVGISAVRKTGTSSASKLNQVAAAVNTGGSTINVHVTRGLSSLTQADVGPP
jgi:Flp pilus assembly pilin Flp